MASGLVLAVLLGACHLEQVQFGQFVRIDTPPVGACAPMEFYFYIDPQRLFHGRLHRDGQLLGDISGTLAQDDSFAMTVTPAGGTAPTRITGTIESVTTTFVIAGNAAGPGCNGQTIRLPTGRLFQGQNPGGDGGG
jgi:hypothetical protein